MSDLVFYEKPGCAGNARQKALLTKHGCRLEVRNLLTERWTVDGLRAYFGEKPVREWFNDSAPRVKSGELAVDRLEAVVALKLMLDDPLLIRRPLMQRGELRQCGFVDGPVLAAVGIHLQRGVDLQSCPRETDSQPVCGESP
ncbi:MAG: nitrogenase-associated protein [Gammaproteobacteria bacterium]|nr:nitrogenase-associated protein [Gammaproteobacteria bacterium]